MRKQDDIDQFRAIIARTFPELATARLRMLKPGWHSDAVEADGRLIFKFPRDKAAASALRREAGLLAVIRPRVAMAVPDLTLHAGPPLFSSHAKIEGEHLLAADYAKLAEAQRRHLAEQLARFYADLHALEAGLMAAAGALPVEAWLGPDEILAKALPALPPHLRLRAAETVAAWRALPPDPYGTTYGFFDGHGWNMAFDHAAGRLNGVYDFADSGFGPLHQDFIYSNMISPGLTARIIGAYEPLAGRALDRRRIALLTGAHRLWELAALADDP